MVSKLHSLVDTIGITGVIGYEEVTVVVKSIKLLPRRSHCQQEQRSRYNEGCLIVVIAKSRWSYAGHSTLVSHDCT